MTNLAATFKQRATELGISQPQLAAVLGLNRQSVYRKLNGLSPMTVGEAYAIAEHLGLKLSKLLREEPEDA
jgi:gp16 family phage-associated protein